MAKKTEMQKIQEKLKKQKQLQQKALDKVKSKKDKKRPQRPQTDKGIKRQMEEDIAIREFFTKLADIPDNQILSELEKFAFDRKGSWNRQRFFTKMINTLPTKLYKEFATAYVNQERKNIEDFYNLYIERPRVDVAIRRKNDLLNAEFQQQIEITEDEKSLKKIQDEILGDEDTTTTDEDDKLPPKKPITPKSKLKLKLVKIGEEGKIIKVLTPSTPKKPQRPLVKKFKPFVDVKCMENQRSLPWIQGRVDATYIAPVLDSNIDEYILSSGKTRKEGNTTWYPANRRFSELMCNNYARSRVQDGDVLTAFTHKGKSVRMKVAYDTNRGFIIQDEVIFQSEKEYLAESRLTRGDKIKKIMSYPVNAVVEKLAVEKLSQELHKVAPDIKDYGIYDFDDFTKNKYDTAYILKAIETMVESSTNTKNFLTKLAEVVVFLRPMQDVGNQIFSKRIQEEYYLPEILVNLTDAEKLPEVFDDPRVSERERNNAIRRIQQEIDYYVSKLGETLYRIKNPTERAPYLPEGHRFTQNVRVEEWKSVCVNKEDVADVPDAQVIYYKEGEEVYCLTIPQIFEQIINNEKPKNPYTQNILPEGFINRFKKLYSIDLKKKGYVSIETTPTVKTPTPKTPTPSPKLAPGLLNMIVNNIIQCEQELVAEELGEDGKCVGLDQGPNNDDTKSDEGVRIVEQDINPINPTMEELFGSDTSDEDIHDFPNATNNTEICNYCKKKVDPKKCLKTKVDNKAGFDTIYFCCFKCFENYDLWPRNKSKKRKNSKKSYNGKKNGRKSSKERSKKSVDVVKN